MLRIPTPRRLPRLQTRSRRQRQTCPRLAQLYLHCSLLVLRTRSLPLPQLEVVCEKPLGKAYKESPVGKIQEVETLNMAFAAEASS